jgi:hypothetical protein
MSMLHMDAQIFSSLFFLGRHMTIRPCRALAFCTHLVIENPWGICHVLMCMHIAEECVAIFRYKKIKKLGIILGSSMWWALEVWTWSVRLVAFVLTQRECIFLFHYDHLLFLDILGITIQLNPFFLLFSWHECSAVTSFDLWQCKQLNLFAFLLRLGS